MKHYKIYVTGKQGIFDPAGKATENALTSLGYAGIDRLRIGKFIELDGDDDLSQEQVAEMCMKLLANPVIEDFRIVEEA